MKVQPCILITPLKRSEGTRSATVSPKGLNSEEQQLLVDWDYGKSHHLIHERLRNGEPLRDANTKTRLQKTLNLLDRLIQQSEPLSEIKQVRRGLRVPERGFGPHTEQYPKRLSQYREFLRLLQVKGSILPPDPAYTCIFSDSNRGHCDPYFESNGLVDEDLNIYPVQLEITLPRGTQLLDLAAVRARFSTNPCRMERRDYTDELVLPRNAQFKVGSSEIKRIPFTRYGQPLEKKVLCVNLEYVLPSTIPKAIEL